MTNVASSTGVVHAKLSLVKMLQKPTASSRRTEVVYIAEKVSSRGSTNLDHTRPLPPLDLTRSSIKGKLALNSVNPKTLPSRMGSQLALRIP